MSSQSETNDHLSDQDGKIETRSFAKCSPRSICIPAAAEILGKACFAGAEIKHFAFQDGSELRSIETACFARCKFGEICLPPRVRVLPASCFAGSTSARLTFDPKTTLVMLGNECFRACVAPFLDKYQRKSSQTFRAQMKRNHEKCRLLI
jgi:hypothetical protein